MTFKVPRFSKLRCSFHKKYLAFVFAFVVMSCNYSSLYGATVDEKSCGLYYSKIEYTYYNLSESGGYTCDAKFTGLHKGESKSVVDIAYTELETVSDINATYTHIGGKTKKIKDISRRSLLSSSFYAGINSYTFTYEPEELIYQFEYSYKLKNERLLFLSFLRLNSYECADTISYTVRVPDNLTFHFEVVGDTGSLKSLNVDSVAGNGYMDYFFNSVVLKKFESSYYSSSGIVSKSIVPGVRLSIIPETEKNGGFAYMNSWYNQLIKSQSELNSDTKAMISKWGEGKEGLSLIKTVFDSVKSKISYIDFENGLGAVQPRNVNDVFLNRQGDCKDMANLLRQSLMYFNIPAWVAISSTVSHPYDLDFPNISSADHLICVVEWDNQIYYLDATERYGLFGFPSRQIQGKHIFLIDEANGRLMLVPVVSEDLNRRVVTFNLFQTGEKLSGTFIITFKGLSQIDFTSLMGRKNSVDQIEMMKNYLETHFGNLTIQNLFALNTDTSLEISGDVESKNVFTTIDGTTYLSQKMLMYPHFYPEKVGDDENLVLYMTLLNEYEYNIELDHDVNLRDIKEESIADNGLRFNYKVVAPEKNKLRIEYLFSCNSILIKDENRITYNNINSKVNSLLNKKLIYD